MPETLGEAVLRLTTDNKALRKGLKEGKKASQGLQESFLNTASVIKVAFAAIAASMALKAILNATVAQEDAVFKLNAALKQNGELVGQNSAIIQAWAGEMQKTTNIADDQALKLFTLARAFTDTASDARELATAAADFAAGADLNVTEAVRRLGRAVRGSAADVSNFVPEIRNLTREQLASGEATRLIAERFRGMAAAATKTLGGEITALKNNFGDLFLELDGPGLESIKGFLRTVNENLPMIRVVFASVFAALAVVVKAFVRNLQFLGLGIQQLTAMDIPAAITSFSNLSGVTTISKDAAAAASKAYNDASAAIAKMAAESARLAAQPLKDLGDKTKEVTVGMSRFQGSIESTFEQMLTDVADGEASFSKFAETVIDQAKKAVIQLIAMKAAMAFVGALGFGASAAGGGAAAIPGKAEGGSMRAGETAWVGEKGPELFTAPSSGYITPNDQTGGGGMTVNLTIPVNGMDFSDEQSIAKVASGLASAAKAGLAEALDAGTALNDAAILNPRRAVA